MSNSRRRSWNQEEGDDDQHDERCFKSFWIERTRKQCLEGRELQEGGSWERIGRRRWRDEWWRYWWKSEVEEDEEEGGGYRGFGEEEGLGGRRRGTGRRRVLVSHSFGLPFVSPFLSCSRRRKIRLTFFGLSLDRSGVEVRASFAASREDGRGFVRRVADCSSLSFWLSLSNRQGCRWT